MFTAQPIHEAAAGGQVAHVQGMLEKDPKLLHARDNEYGWTPLVYAASEGQLGMVKLLLQSGADIDDSDDDGDTALQIACVHGHCAAVALLTEQGADVSLTDVHGRTPLMRAARGGHVAVVELLVAHTDTDVDAADGRRQTALWIAASVGCEEVVMVLLCAGADPFIADEQASTPREAAMHRGKHVCATLLEEWETTYTFSRARRLRDATADIHHRRPLPTTPHTISSQLQHPLSDHQQAIDVHTEANPPLYLCTRVADTMALPWVVGRGVDTEGGGGAGTDVRHEDGSGFGVGGCSRGGGGGGGSEVTGGVGRKRSFDERSESSGREGSNGERRCSPTSGRRQRSDGGEDAVVSTTRMCLNADVDVGCDGDRGGGSVGGEEGLPASACSEGLKTMSGMVVGYLLGDLKSELFVEMLESVI